MIAVILFNFFCVENEESEMKEMRSDNSNE